MSKKGKKLLDGDINPCLEEHNASRKCMEYYEYNRDMCSFYFHTYRKCRKYWQDVMIQRRREGIKPEMPSAEERLEILTALGGRPWLDGQ